MKQTKITRRSFVKTAALSSAALMLAPRLRAQTIHFTRKPNLLVFLPDEFRADMIGCYGARYAFAPSLDKLASQSCIFEHAYVTQPICTPSRSSLLSGTWPHQNGCLDNAGLLPDRFEALPQLLGDSDYRTGYLGKWHLGHEFQAQRGFDEWASIIDGKAKKSGLPPGQVAMSDYAKFLVAHGLQAKHNAKEPFSKHFITHLPLELSRVRFLENKAVDFLQRHHRDPFILFVAFYEPHPPYDGPLNNHHPREHVDLEPTFGKIFGEDIPDRYRQRQVVQAKTVAGDAESYRKIKQHYLGLVTEVDLSIGAILSKLEQLGLNENTVVVHTSDHGDMMGAHGLFEKSVMFEEALRVPLLLRMPGQTRAQHIAAPFSHIDLVPTLLDLLGRSAAEQPVGRSRASILQNPGEQNGETIFAQWNGRDTIFTKSGLQPTNETVLNESTRTAISSDGWKLCLRDLDKNELYRMREDPREEHNLYHDAASKDVVARLTREIHDCQERLNDSIQLRA